VWLIINMKEKNRASRKICKKFAILIYPPF
jgi:hypothetical protein